jgi:hypothetical protein
LVELPPPEPPQHRVEVPEPDRPRRVEFREPALPRARCLAQQPVLRPALKQEQPKGEKLEFLLVAPLREEQARHRAAQ